MAALSFERLMGMAHSIAIARHAAQIQGIAALKRPNTAYRNGVFEKSCALLAAESFNLELGWVVVRPEARGRGIAVSLVASLIEQARGEAIYATSNTTNEAMHAVLRKFGFQSVGTSYASQRRDAYLQLFVRNQGLSMT
ncbi:GNAT family N-acetyltransferase [Dyella tabacisoli]|uniref:GNAT family N-acetyltransferase n=1 Tax=Dyella tabacisoli TaxID=2282381 RepID=UPI0013B3D876|nr:GNAT family N-acetyltransferase [Dyella tabacisoli]